MMHGAGGSAGAVALILSALDDRTLACVALVVIATFAGLSMMFCSWLMCRGVDRLDDVASPRLIVIWGSALAMLFGAWYFLAAVAGVWYPA
jgi:hypothetical protein